MRYSYLLNTIFVTMMYGTAIPILFPIAFLSIFLVYFFENFMLFYVCKMPVAYDGTLHKIVLRQLKYAALVGFALNFWQLSNYGLFDYSEFKIDEIQLTSIRRRSEPIYSNHLAYRYFSYEFAKENVIGPAKPHLIYFVIYLSYLVLRHPFNRLRKCKITKKGL